MTLEEFISSQLLTDTSGIVEAVSSGKHRMTDFPISTDRADIEKWLKKNGFVLVKSQIGRSIQDNEVLYYIIQYGDRIYNLGDFKSDGTHWIEFGDRNCFFKMRLDKDFEKFLDSPDSYCSLRMYDLNKMDPKFPKGRLLMAFTNLDDFADKVNEMIA